MGLLQQAKDEKAQDAANKEKERLAQEKERNRRAEAKKKFQHEWFLRLKKLIQEGDIKVNEISKGFAFASLHKKGQIIGFFHEVEQSGSEYDPDYGCDVGWYHHELVFSPAEHYIEGNTKDFFSVSFKDKEEETLAQISRNMISFYKTKGWV